MNPAFPVQSLVEFVAILLTGHQQYLSLNRIFCQGMPEGVLADIQGMPEEVLTDGQDMTEGVLVDDQDKTEGV